MNIVKGQMCWFYGTSSLLLFLLLVGPALQVIVGSFIVFFLYNLEDLKGITDLQVRLAGVGSSGREGRVEVRRFNNESWSTVCNSLWNAPDAAVVCRQLNPNYAWGEALTVYNSLYGQGNGTISLSNVMCIGNETNLGHCQSNAWGSPTYYCRHYQDAAVRCHQYKVRLVPQTGSFSGANYGAVEVLREADYSWVPLCDSQWDDNDAKVICKSLGFFDGKHQCCGRLTRGTNYRSGSATNITCTGSETTFDSCSYNYSTSRCPSSPGLAAAICYSSASVDTDDFNIKLENSSQQFNWGRVEVKHLGVWGSVCAGNTWNNTAATIVCKEVTAKGGGVVLGHSGTESFVGSAWVTQLNCSGHETSLSSCVVPPWGAARYFCQPQYTLCYSSSAPVVSLVGGDGSYGRVEITVDGLTYTVCDDGWNEADANVVCRSLGYGGGQAVKYSHYGSGTHSVALNGVFCNGNENNLLECRNSGWLVSTPECDGHRKDASVYCHGPVRLVLGDHSNGILQVSSGGIYRTVCGTGFDDTDAAVACNDLGFEHGRKLPQGSYGTHYSSAIWRNLTCRGNESSIFNCTYTSASCYTSWYSYSYTNYAAVHCYNGTLDTTSSLSLKGGLGSMANFSGHVMVQQNGVNGRICANYWDDNDAKVACKELGYQNGVVYGLSTPVVGPILINEINCVGTESTFFQCPTGNASCTTSSLYYYTSDAGVLCFNNDAPEVQLVDGASEMEGRVQIVFGGMVGSVCISQTYYRDTAASVVCQSLGYATGIATSVTGASGDVALSWVYCDGLENSLIACKSNGFFAPPSGTCANHNDDLGVICQWEVKLTKKSQSTNNTVVGVVQLFENDRWNYVCGDMFDEIDAGVVCRQLGYQQNRVLPPGAFGRIYFYNNVVSGVNCSGSESSLEKCPHVTGSCVTQNNMNYAAVICSKTQIPQGIQAIEPMSQPGFAVVSVDGLHSAICSLQWDHKDASVYCRTLGYRFGRAFGTIYALPNLPRIVLNVTCDGSETRFSECTFSSRSLTSCGYYEYARVFCYNNQEDFQVRLTGGQVRSEGNLEIGLNGQWGSVCDYQTGFTANDASVACRSLGFLGGSALRSGTFGSAINPTLIIIPRCFGSEDSITFCSMRFFNDSYYTGVYRCSSTPVSVRCTGEVKLNPNTTYGPLQMLTDRNLSTYGYVCSDGFGVEEAIVACRDLGYAYGLSICCSAFGSIYPLQLQRTNLQCTGREPMLRDCSYSESMTYCTSRQYASVICSNLSPNTGYEVAVETVQGYPYGRVKVKHMGYWGYVCPDGFDNNDASVICREAGYAGGIFFDYYQYRYRRHNDIRWLSNIDCAGNEAYLIQCKNIVWGNVTQCSKRGDAAVFCYQNSVPEFHLVNGTDSRGRLELWSDDFRGTVCGMYWMDYEADPACKDMGFNGGRNLNPGSFGQGTGDVLIQTAFCYGWETSLFQCYIRLKGIGRYFTCNNHDYDAAVQCFNTTRLVGSTLAYYGRVEVFTNQTWVAVCDQGFSMQAARVVCRSMGYTEARAQCCSAIGPLVSYRYYRTANRIGAVVSSCDGSEASLMDCNISTTATCSSGKYASVLCSDDPIQELRLQTRLKENIYGTDRSYLGGVQVNRYGFWGPVCNKSWDDRDANATCHGLGYQYGISFYGIDYTGLPMVVGDFQCTGLEQSLADCNFKDIDDDINCSLPTYYWKRQDAGALCFNTPGVGIRLVDGGNNYGRVEVQFQGEWGRVADYYWSNADAVIACQQLGYKGGSPSPSSMVVSHPNSSAKIWLNYVYCNGHERTLFECYNYWDYRLYYTTDANVICYNNVRLTRGNQVSTGVVEVNINNKWGSICDNEWSDRNTELTCKNLGYDNGYHLCCGTYGNTNYPLMESVACSDTDTDLPACSHSVPSQTTCSRSSVAVACYTGAAPTDFTYRLNGGPSNNTGEVQLTFMNVTGRICSDGWDDTDAQVFCSELGFEHGQAYEHYLFNYYYSSSNTGPFWTTNVNCQGSESRLRDCQLSVGRVSQCLSGLTAGVLCTNTEGIFYRLGGSDSEVKGRVEVAVDGEWGTVCQNYFGGYAASVFCRSQGFNEGIVDYAADDYPNPPSKIYQSTLQCRGDEQNLDDCPHTGWIAAISSFCTHSNDAKVICFGDVRIGGTYDTSIKQGPVQFYVNGTWYNLCDTGFDDVTAKRVCQDLQFVDGKAVCCSAYGSTAYYVSGYETHLNYTMHCKGSEKTSQKCISSINNCDSGNYASVVCFNSSDYVDENTYTFDFLDSSKTSGVIAVTYMNITGRVCNNNWDDNDARVICRTKGHLDGIAFHYSQYNYASFNSRGPFLVSDVNCTGNETRLQDCPFSDRLHMGNCSRADLAGAICFNDSGIQYRLSNDSGKANEGRVEISVGGVWGTVCSYYWDNEDAKVFCRDLGYHDGYSVSNTYGTMGSGPMWLSYLRCTGNESSLHLCPHSGFSDVPVDDGYYYGGCSSHIIDAYVSCVKNLKLSLGYQASMGAVMVYQSDGWNFICDEGLTHSDAQVICRMYDYQFGTNIPGSIFGTVDWKIGITNVQCHGTERDFTSCPYDVSTACRSQKYASVYCSHDPIHEEIQTVRIRRDDPTDPRHGYLEYQVNGLWGAVCAATFDTNAATVACKQLGFNGGVLYKPHSNNNMNKEPILTSDLKCSGSESKLDDCAHTAVPDSARCDYSAPRAGILCYNDTNGAISYRLAGDDVVPTRGRFEMQYMGQYGIVCSYYSPAAGRVACKTLGYADGLTISGTRYTTSSEPVWFFYLTCQGNENSVPECGSNGFNIRSQYSYYMESSCRSTTGPLSVQCYRDPLVFTDIRLVDGTTNSSGRVEVYLEGPNQWGTVCDDLWNDIDATVVCRQLGFATGKAIIHAGFGQGSGNIWMDAVGCQGTETRLQDCSFIGYGQHNCLHTEDAGVICSGIYVPPTTTSVKPKTSEPSKRTSSSNQKTDKPPATQSQIKQTESNTTAIVVPIVVILVLAIAAVVGFILYRRHRNPSNIERLTDTGPTQSNMLTFSRGGVVRFINKMRSRGKGDDEGMDFGGVNNPGYESQDSSKTGFDNSSSIVLSEHHADFATDA